MESAAGEQDRTKQAALDFGWALSVFACFGARNSQEVANFGDIMDEFC